MGDTQEEVRIDETLREVVASIDVTRNDVTVTTELPPKSPLTTNGEAARIAVESACENAIEHGESA